MEKEWTIRLLTADDAELLSGLAITIYKQYYTHLWHDGGQWYIEYSYNVQKLRKELTDLTNFHYLACSGEHPVGYLKIRLNEKWKGLEDHHCLEVERIYILQEAAGFGLGKKLMDVAREIAKYHNQDILFLKAMDSSSNALDFYQKLGFTIFDTLTLPFQQMKKEYRGMVVLKLDLLVYVQSSKFKVQGPIGGNNPACPDPSRWRILKSCLPRPWSVGHPDSD